MRGIIAIWHSGLQGAVDFANRERVQDNLVGLLPDTEMRHSLWGVYRVDAETYKRLTSIPRLTWK